MTELKKIKESKDPVLVLLIIASVILLIYSFLYIFNYYSENQILVHFPNNISSTKKTLEPNEIGDSIGGTLNPIIAFTASILTFLAFYIQFKANKSQREIFNLSLENELGKLNRDKLEIENHKRENLETDLKIFKSLAISMLFYYENSGENISEFFKKEMKKPLSVNSLIFITDSSNNYFNRLDFKEIYSSIVLYFNENYKGNDWETEFVEVLNLLDFYNKFLDELKNNFKMHSSRKHSNISSMGQKLTELMGSVLTDEILNKDESLINYFKIIHNEDPITRQKVVSDEEFYKFGVDYEKLHKDFFPSFISFLKLEYDKNKSEKLFNLLEEFSKMHKTLGTEIFHSTNFARNLQEQYNSYFEPNNSNYPMNIVKEFIAKINFR